MLSFLPAVTKEAGTNLAAQFSRLQAAIEMRDVQEVRRTLIGLEDLAASTDPQQLSVLLDAENLLARSHGNRDLREGILLAVMVQSRRLGHQDLQMSVYFNFAALLREKGEHQHADDFLARSRELEQSIFGAISPVLPPLPIASPGTLSSIAEEGSVRVNFGALGARTWLGILSNADTAMRRGLALRRQERWEEARGEFFTAYWVLERDGEAVSDGVLVRAQAASLIAETYNRKFLYDDAIPYAEHAVRIYQNQPRHRAPHAFRDALFVLLEAYSVGPYYAERCDIQRLLDEFPDVG